ncbi:MAG TPA: dihydrolipoyl dehydrogenase [Negativicutes bacterium]|nr:dihydrolipoyl dehydrogenase [Negativicutes bacterium]
MTKKIVIIGGGPGGYVSAIRAAQLGAETHLVEKGILGGTCLNVGCIPTKTLLHTAELYHAVRFGERIGLNGEQVLLDWSALMKRKQSVVRRLVGGVSGLLKANGVIVHKGTGEVIKRGIIKVHGEKEEVLKADFIILATGSAPVKLNFPGRDLPGVIDSTDALSLDKLPASMVVIGGGYIGIEFAALFAALGSKVTVVELLPEILQGIDSELVANLKQSLEKEGVLFITKAKIDSVTRTTASLTAKILVNDGEEVEIAAETVLIAVGRQSFTEGAGLDLAGVKMERGKVIVDSNFESNKSGIYAIGDCNGISMLAHAASHQGIAAVEHALVEGHSRTAQHIVPACIYTHPEIASVGITEDTLKEKGYSYKTGVFPLAGNGKAMIEEGETGFIKILASITSGEILGVHMIGPRVTEIIGEATLAMRMKATVDDLITTIHAHPTVSEAFGEAALALSGQAIHWPPSIKKDDFV